MCSHIVATENHIYRGDLTTFQLDGLFQQEIDLVEISVQHFKVPFERTEEDLQLRIIGNKMVLAKSGKGICISIRLPPEGSYLPYTSFDAEIRGFAQRIFQC